MADCSLSVYDKKINKQPKTQRWNFCSHFEQIADSPNFLRKVALEFCLRQKSLKLRHSSNWAANLFKIWQNSNAAFSVAYLFFIIYQKSKVWTIARLENLSGCVCWVLSFFNFCKWQTVFIINTNTVKHTHCVVVWIDFRCMWRK